MKVMHRARHVMLAAGKATPKIGTQPDGAEAEQRLIRLGLAAHARDHQRAQLGFEQIRLIMLLHSTAPSSRLQHQPDNHERFFLRSVTLHAPLPNEWDMAAFDAVMG